MRKILLAVAFGLIASVTPNLHAQPAVKKDDRPRVEVVFCLDTTGSMSSLLNAAKQKIWSISNQISSGKPTPLVKIGLVAYRDRTDAYVTKVSDLSDDLDAIHGHLMSFQAQGGGDFPESVNQALHESVTKISWSKDKRTLRMIFLVGDAPPHMDYRDDVKYPVTCKLALERDIIINTVQCGNHAETRKYWQDISRSAEGSYVQIDQSGGPVVVTATPFDAELGRLNVALDKTQVMFGSKQAQLSGVDKLKTSAALPAAAQADRAAFNARAGGTSYDLIQNLKDGKVKLEQLKKDELPDELQNKTVAEQKEILKNIEQKRGELSRQAIELDKKRNEYIAKKLAEDTKNRARDSFDNQVLQILQRQATRNNIDYGAVEEKKK